MSWEDVFKVLTAALLSAGGAGGLILLISKFLSKAMFERYMEKVKNDYDIELTELKAEKDSLVFTSNMQYEKEFQIYQEVWASFFDCLIVTNSLYPSGLHFQPLVKEELKKFQEDKFHKWATSYNELLNKMSHYEPFMRNEIYEKLNETRKVMVEVGSIFEHEELLKYKTPTYAMVQNERMDSKTYQYVWSESHTKLEKLKNETKELLQIYLESLKHEIKK